MKLKCRRIAALLLSCALFAVLLITVTVHAEPGDKIYAKALKTNITEISVVRYGENGTNVLDTWVEGMFGTSTGEWLFCTEPDVDFVKGYKTGVPAEDHMSGDTIRLIGAMMYWYDENMCKELDSTDEYLFKQEIVWNILNMEKKWEPGCRYEHGRGETCGCGRSLESHRKQIFSEGLKWAEQNGGKVKTDATVYEGEGQMLMDLVYSWQPPKGNLQIRKTSANPDITEGNACYSLAGAEYRIYSDKGCTKLVCTLITDETGKTAAKEIEAGEYFVKEYAAPEGYALDSVVYPVTVGAGKTEIFSASDVPQSDPVNILLAKEDADTGTNEPLGAAVFKGAEFTVCYYTGMYTSEPSVRPERTWVFAADEEGVCTLDESSLITGDSLYMNSKGEAVLPLGTVTIRETKAPEGYLKNDEVFIRQITVEGMKEQVKTFNKADIPQKVIRGKLQIVKIGQNPDENAEHKKPLEGAVFEITSRTTGRSVRITTDEHGFASSDQVGNLPYDTYVVSEVVTPEGYDPVEDFEITVSEEGQVLYYILEDKIVMAPVRLIKLSGDTGKTIPAAGVQFQLLDSEKNPVSMTTYYPKEETGSIFTTDETGSFILPEKLPAGIYYFREVKAPEGYLISSEDVRFEVTKSYDWEEPVVVSVKNTPVTGKIRVKKTGEENGEPVPGAVLEITAAEDIVTPDGVVRLRKGETADTVTTAENGMAETKKLFPGKYNVKEKSAPAGYILNPRTYELELKYKDQNTPTVYADVRITDSLAKGKIRIIKKDSETGKIIPGKAEFEIIAAEDIITPDGAVQVEKGTVADTVTTGENGNGISGELFLGNYYVKEKQAPEGYLLNKQSFAVELSYQDQNTEIVRADLTIPDTPAMGRIRIEKSDEYTGKPLKNAVFSITAAEDIVTPDGTVRLPEGAAAAEISTDEDGTAESSLLYPGKYTIREERQPDGYVFPQNNGWTVELRYQDQDTPVVIRTEAIQNRPTVVIIDKKVSGSEQRLSGVKFMIRNKDKEDNSDPALKEEDIYITDNNGQIRFEALVPGHYCVQEVEGIPGYAKDPSVYEFVIGEDGRIEDREEYTLTVENKKTEITETNALSADTDGKETYPWEKTVIKDSVKVINIQPGEEYRLKGVLMDQETGEILRGGGLKDGNPLEAEYVFTGTEPEMTTDMVFEFDASPFAGRTVVVYEYLYQNDVLISEHTDPEDEKQQFRIIEPEMGTTAISPETGSHEAAAGENTVIHDQVLYSGIIPGTYILKGVLMDRETGEPLLVGGEKITAEKELNISEAEGKVIMEFVLDASELDGREAVVFEYLYRKGYQEPAASHEDITDSGQTVIFREKIMPHTGDAAPVVLFSVLAAAGAGSMILLLLIRAKKRRILEQ